ncbi:hypothetical protein [Amycolatopsis japonica]
MDDLAAVRTAIRLNNRVWWCLYYDELYEADDLQCTYMRDADEDFYNCAQALGRADDSILEFVEDYYAPAITPAVYVDPAAPPSLVPLLHARQYAVVPEEREFWYRYPLLDGPGPAPALKVATERVEVLRIDPLAPELDDFVHINKVASRLSTEVAGNLRRNLIQRRLHDVRMVLLLALLDGRPAATGAVGICQGMAFLAEGGTLDFARGLGLHSFLIHQRLATAEAAGATVAFGTTAVDTLAHRSLRRVGFDLVWTRDYFRRTRTVPSDTAKGNHD